MTDVMFTVHRAGPLTDDGQHCADCKRRLPMSYGRGWDEDSLVGLGEGYGATGYQAKYPIAADERRCT